MLDREREGLRAAELLVRRMHLRFLTGRDFFPVADMQEASSSPLSPGEPGVRLCGGRTGRRRAVARRPDRFRPARRRRSGSPEPADRTGR